MLSYGLMAFLRCSCFWLLGDGLQYALALRSAVVYVIGICLVPLLFPCRDGPNVPSPLRSALHGQKFKKNKKNLETAVKSERCGSLVLFWWFTSTLQYTCLHILFTHVSCQNGIVLVCFVADIWLRKNLICLVHSVVNLSINKMAYGCKEHVGTPNVDHGDVRVCQRILILLLMFLIDTPGFLLGPQIPSLTKSFGPSPEAVLSWAACPKSPYRFIPTKLAEWPQEPVGAYRSL